MKLKKGKISLLACVSVLLLLFSACSNPNSSEKEKEDKKKTETASSSGSGSGGGQGSSGQTDPGPSVNGIELTWENLPAGTKAVVIETKIGNEGFFQLFKINDLLQYSSILDENVDAGKNYTYRFIYRDENNSWIGQSKEVTIKARGGKGEKALTVTPAEDGISLSLKDLSDPAPYNCTIYKKEAGNPNTYRIAVWNNNGSLPENFTDKFVDPGKSYEYRPNFQVGDDNDALVEWPRYKYVSVTASAGSGNVKTTTNPNASYNDSNETITLTQKPVFNNAPENWSVQLNYSNLNGNGRTIANFSSYDQEEDLSQSLQNLEPNLWTFLECYYYLQYEDFAYQYAEYNNPGLPESIALRVNEDELFLPKTSATGQGIEITWQNLPANTQIIDIQDADNGATLFRVNDLSQITSVTDKYVTNDNTYRYQIIARDQNGNWLERSGIARQKASAGLGELTFTAQAAGNGIRLTGQRASTQSEFRIYKRISSRSGNSDTITLNNSSSSFNLTDPFVSAGTDYEYRVQETIGNERSYWQNNVQIPADPLVEYPRFKTQTVTANGGSGNIRISNSPYVSYNDSTESVTFSPNPRLSASADSFEIYFNYSMGNNNGSRTIYSYSSRYDNQTVSLNNNLELGQYTFSNYSIYAEFNSFRYSHSETSLDDFGNFPETINITGANRLKLIASNVSDGIKLEWQNLPANTKTLEIRDNNSGYPLFTVTDLTQVTSVTDKYVTSGNTYWYYFAAIDENGRWIKQSEIISKEANSGSGELTFSAHTTANGVVLTGQRAISDSNSQFRIIKKLGTTNNNEEGDTITLNESTSKSYSITDPYVTNGTNYVYIVNENIGYAWDHWNNGTQYPPDPLVIYPRFNNREIAVTDAVGSGDLKITNTFSITYDASNEKFIFSKKPELNVTANSWSIWFNYSRGNGNGWGTLYSIGSNSNTTVGFNNYQAGQWNFVNYEIQARFDDYSYLRHETSSDVFEAIPETVTISN